ncbi:peptidoglycan recognition protein [Streptomyces sp. NPDC020807]|uniref:peptidoglycan recognition protein family protein n=1 Tax=Streptomyces sp. NPDC020807 TaxID=3155119 RepID=UPI0033F71D73
MRASLASSIAVTCAAVLALPVSLAAPAAASVPTELAAAPPAAALPPGPELLPGSTQSLPLAPLRGSVRAFGGGVEGVEGTGAGDRGLARRDVSPFSLVGVVWDDPAAALHGTVQVRTRATGGEAWSDWQDVETHNDEHGADPETAEAAGGADGPTKGATAPLWVGDSDGVEIRVRGEETLPEGLRLELVDPGGAERRATAAATTATTAATATTASATTRAAASAAHADRAEFGGAWIPALSKQATEDGTPARPPVRVREKAPAEPVARPPAEAVAQAPTLAPLQKITAQAKPYIGPRPKIITRKGWGADEKLREKGFVYTKTIKAAFVHHSATGNNYTCRQAPSVLRGIYRYHVKSSGWRDFGYNFAVDKCGNIYEGRAGGVAKPVLGAHTLGFNTNSMGIAVLGTYSKSAPPAAAVTAVAKLTAWKLGLHGVNPKGTTTLVSGGGNLYAKGKSVKFRTIAGHRDGFATECPGARLYNKLSTARTSSAKYQGRR